MVTFPSPLIRGSLLRRYKRFLADVEVPGEGRVTAHCPNPGSMMGLAEPGLAVWLSCSPSRNRKHAHTLEIVEARSAERAVPTGINTGLPNRLVEEAIIGGRLAELAGYASLRREVRYGASSRIDMLLSAEGRPQCYVEVKNVHLVREPGLAEFPDCVTARGAKHLRELAAMVAAGHRAMMVFCVQRGDAEAFRLAGDLDPAYARAFREAVDAGVEAVCYRCRVTPLAIDVEQSIPILLP